MVEMFYYVLINIFINIFNKLFNIFNIFSKSDKDTGL